jgi:hypothetical protein
MWYTARYFSSVSLRDFANSSLASGCFSPWMEPYGGGLWVAISEQHNNMRVCEGCPGDQCVHGYSTKFSLEFARRLLRTTIIGSACGSGAWTRLVSELSCLDFIPRPTRQNRAYGTYETRGHSKISTCSKAKLMQKHGLTQTYGYV